MYRLAELSDGRRKAIGSGLLLLGIASLALGVFWLHWASYPQTQVVDGVEVIVVVDYFNWFPRGILWKAAGYLIVGGATTFLLVGATFLWVLNQPMTWARATVAALIAWVALVFFFGMVPSEWLNFAQTDLEWSSQRVALVIPSWLVLGNEVEISYAAIKDAISGGYHVVMLVAAAVLTIQIQKMKQGRPAAQQKDLVSPYGRPLVRGDG
ncbi:MAG: hypothetical protein L0Z49_09500 [Actinobacteria bacterium]|nr:hypothetical protein [Actinomycetota bacterium]MCI0544660.1 hypothetical protein [Actinomycetota bacterium]